VAAGQPRLAYSTPAGGAYQGESRLLLQSSEIKPGSVDLIFTSPPFALTRPKDYGNETQAEYVEWFKTFLPGFQRVLSDRGSLVIDIGGSFLPGKPRRSTYHFELAVLLAQHFDLCQEFYWFNPAKLPSPAEWTTVRRLRVKDSVNLVLWLAKDASRTKADNRRVLRRYSDSMRSLLKNGYQVRQRPSNHDISQKFLFDNRGSIPSNLLGFVDTGENGQLEGSSFEEAFDNLVSIANTVSSDPYLRKCLQHQVKPHGARFPAGLPAFFIEFLTEKMDLVLDPFAGSNTTGWMAEALGRRWISCELDAEGGARGTYVRTSAFRFPHARLTREFRSLPEANWFPRAGKARPTGIKR
jgi:site-specific DNA-methyltransferase (cytosine-N4-specific)